MRRATPVPPFFRMIVGFTFGRPKLSHIGRHPDSGASRYAGELNLPGLRCWRLKKYPHLVFYVERSDHIDVWRVLHGMRDIPSWMQDPDLI